MRNDLFLYTSGPAFNFTMLPPGAKCRNCGAPGQGYSCLYCLQVRSGPATPPPTTSMAAPPPR